MEPQVDVRDQPGRRLADPDEQSLPELFARMTHDLSTLLQKELALAKVEMKEEATKAGRGAGALGATGVAALLAVLMFSFAAAWGLAAVIPTGFAFLVVGLCYLAGAGVFFLIGRKELSAVDPVPQQTVETLKEDAAWAKQLMS